ncbi:DUF2461 domain-containing protein [Arenibacter sp. 6A1]|uniref:DUF2461 domain-containing protein n=1 Tax=Arenibacter sp. 6A1 TaxID=2720391 RepID=UPI001445922A|nr:DUF2461 domain-containing protein [Arenibacter sp. 6A1]NKI24989.1 DUF2461 domain-containing protein [Arenibacter sp. 6A1]
MAQQVITKEAFLFLQKLEKNNNREWFTDSKKEFKIIETEVKGFFTALKERLQEHDEIDQQKMFRIYRDVRFSKNKTPYKTHFAGSFSRAGAQLRGGYYIQIKPKGSFIAAGFWGPNKEDLFRIRKEFETDASEIRNIINTPSFHEIWGELKGEALKTAPSGFHREHPDIDLIRQKQFIFVKEYSDEEVLSPDFITKVNDSFRAIRPYFDLMSDILTTDLNGASLLE